MRNITPPPGGKLSTRSSTSKAARGSAAASGHRVIDSYLEDYFRNLDGDDYSAECTSLFANIERRWRCFVDRVTLTDRAMRAPLRPGNDFVLANAYVLASDGNELALLVADVGEAIGWHRGTPMCLPCRDRKVSHGR